MLLKMILIVIGVLGLLLAGALLAVELVFSRYPQYTAKTVGYLKNVKHQRDVTLGGGRYGRETFVKHLSHGTYFYYVNNKTYRIKDMHVGTPRQMQRRISVQYLKRFPFLSYIDGNMKMFSVYALLILLCTLPLLIIGFSVPLS